MRVYGQGPGRRPSSGLERADPSRNVVYFVGANLTTGRTNLVGLTLRQGTLSTT